MEAKITFEEISEFKSGNAMLWHYGTARINGKDFDFTLCETVVNGDSSFEVFWPEDAPESEFEVNKLIIEEFLNELEKSNN